IGRTGRAGLRGEAISLVALEDFDALAAVEKLIKQKLQVAEMPPSGVDRQARSNEKQRDTDPLFHQPYVSAHRAKAQPAAEPRPLGAVASKKKEKQIAALFLPPASKPDA
ncbi:MAG: hypothetical protein GTO41_06430, partial [Burkholderiales bacterium]|nr:hypothetical protein [Burkholderiales bacterium]